MSLNVSASPTGLAAPPDDLWHVAADELHDARAEAGMTWLTLCGQMRPPQCEDSDGPIGTAADDCMRCASLWAEWPSA